MGGASALQIDPVTGIISGTPNTTGRNLMAVSCNERRSGVLIKTIKREVKFTVTQCTYTYQPFAGNDTAIMVGDSIQFHATNGTFYSWSPGTYLSATNISNPVGHFPVAGTFAYTVHSVSDSICEGDDTIVVVVLGYSSYYVPNAFSPNGDNLNDVLKPMPIEKSTLHSFKVFDRKGIVKCTALTCLMKAGMAPIKESGRI